MDPAWLFSVDRMLTTKQKSRIEQEHPRDKALSNSRAIRRSGSIVGIRRGWSLAENLQDSIQAQIRELSQQTQPPGRQSINGDVHTIAEVSADAYRELIRSKVENLVLSKYGIEIDDLSAQNQFKDPSRFTGSADPAIHIREWRYE